MTKINQKILIVEDDTDFLSILQIKFISEGFSVFTAGNGEEGLIVAEKEKPDLIISDVLMPKMNGIEMEKKIREAGNKALFIFLTNTKEADYSGDVKKIDESDYLIKSELRISDIVDKVKSKLRIK